MLAPMGRFAQTRWARMSSGQYCLIRDLGLVKGGKGLRHHEVVLTLSWRGVLRFLVGVAREIRWRDVNSGLDWIARAPGQPHERPRVSEQSKLTPT
jgi:hypothetical protein